MKSQKKIFLVAIFILVALFITPSSAMKFLFHQTNDARDKWVSEKLQTLTLREKIGQLFLVRYDLSNTANKQDVSRLLAQNAVSGIVLHSGNPIQLKETIPSLQKQSKLPLLVTIDEDEMGVKNGDAFDFPRAETLRAFGDSTTTHLFQEMYRHQADELGLNLNTFVYLPKKDSDAHKTGVFPFPIANVSVDYRTNQSKANANLRHYIKGELLLNVEQIDSTITAIEHYVSTKKGGLHDLNRMVGGVLAYKYDLLHSTTKTDNYALNETPRQVELLKDKVANKVVTMLKDENNFFPFTTYNYKGIVISVGNYSLPFRSMMSNMTATQIISYDSFKSLNASKRSFSGLNQVLIAVHSTAGLKNRSMLKQELGHVLAKFPHDAKKGLLLFDSPSWLTDDDLLAQFDAVAVAYEDTYYLQNRAAQIICGAMPMQGELARRYGKTLVAGEGITYPALNRLAFVEPEEVGFTPQELSPISDYIRQCIADGVMPGGQVAFAYKGKVFYNESFGKLTYDGTQKVANNDIYDLASVTKVVASTPSLMLLQTEGKFSLDKTLEDYLPDLVKNSTVRNIVLRASLAHQAGFVPYIPFYKETIVNHQLDSSIYNKVRTDYYNVQVANNIWINNHYRDSMMVEILKTPLRNPGRYKYSDVGYYFVQRIIEKLTGTTENNFVLSNLYHPLGLNRTGYLPQTFYPLSKIAPTENDTIFRKQVVHGFVHDPGAAMQGGVAGHAGVFSNATDLLAILQMYLNKGSFAGHQFISPEVLAEYTREQFPGNRRGAGFDRPVVGKNIGPTCELASDESYGHSGFTGTFVWVDPKYDLTYVFLSNRVYPDAENWKITKLDVRTNIQRMIYQLIQSKQK